MNDLLDLIIDVDVAEAILDAHKESI